MIAQESYVTGIEIYLSKGISLSPLDTSISILWQLFIVKFLW